MEQAKAEAELEANTVCSMYEEQVQELQAERDQAQATAAQDKEAALSAQQAEHAQAIEQTKSEAELETTTVCQMYEEQIQGLQAERDTAKAAAEAASGSGAEATARMVS